MNNKNKIIIGVIGAIIVLGMVFYASKYMFTIAKIDSKNEAFMVNDAYISGGGNKQFTTENFVVEFVYVETSYNESGTNKTIPDCARKIVIWDKENDTTVVKTIDWFTGRKTVEIDNFVFDINRYSAEERDNLYEGEEIGYSGSKCETFDEMKFDIKSSDLLVDVQSPRDYYFLQNGKSSMVQKSFPVKIDNKMGVDLLFDYEITSKGQPEKGSVKLKNGTNYINYTITGNYTNIIRMNGKVFVTLSEYQKLYSNVANLVGHCNYEIDPHIHGITNCKRVRIATIPETVYDFTATPPVIINTTTNITKENKTENTTTTATTTTTTTTTTTDECVTGETKNEKCFMSDDKVDECINGKWVEGEECSSTPMILIIVSVSILFLGGMVFTIIMVGRRKK